MEPFSDSEWRDWACGLPSVLLVAVFDNIITCPTAHPSYLKVKGQHYSYISRVCKNWGATLHETPIGVCLPAQLCQEAINFVCNAQLRGVEYHDPERTHPSVVAILSDPRLIERSGKSLHNIIDAPFDGIWKPEDFPNISQLVVWRYGTASSSWDVRCISKLPQLNYLVLAAGFKSLKHMEVWPAACKHLVWTSPSDSHNSRITVPAIPKHVNLHWMSLRAYAVRLQDPVSLLGKVQEITIHSAFIFAKVPQRLYPSLAPLYAPAPASSEPTVSSSSSSSDAAQGGARPQMTLVQRLRQAHRVLSDSWPEEGLTAFANMYVQEHTMKCLRIKFGRMLICHPLGLPADEPEQGGLDTTPPGGAPSTDQPPQQPEADEDGWSPARHRGRVFRPSGDEHGPGSEDGSEGDFSDEEDLTYDEVTYDQVKLAFHAAIKTYTEAVKARGPAASVAFTPPPIPAAPTSCTSCDEMLPPWIIPELECGKHKPGQERDLCVSRRYADPREPARLKLDEPEGLPHLTLTAQAPLLLTSKRAVQAIAFAPWPFHPGYLEKLARQVAGGGDGSGGGGGGGGGGGEVTSAAGEQGPTHEEQGSSGDDNSSPSAAAASGGPQMQVDGTGEVSLGAASDQGCSLAVEVDGGSTGVPDVSPAVCVAAAAQQQHAFLRDPRFLESSSQHLRKLNFLLLGATSPLDTKLAKALLAPFAQLTKISVITPPGATNISTPIFPISVVKVGLYASTPDQRFHAGIISNLTELWRLTLNGYQSFDLFDLPAVRPGFIIKIMDTPSSRQEPLGKPGLDTLMPRGKLVDVSVQLGTDKAADELDVPVCRVHLGQWSNLCGDMHVRCPPGVELYTGARSVPELFRQLSNSGLCQFTICLAIEPGAVITYAPHADNPVFSFVMSNGTRFHGMSVVMLVRERVVPDWEVELVDAGMTGQEAHGMFYITFAYTGEQRP